MGGSVNLKGGGQYQMPTTGTGESYSPSYTPSGYGARYGGYGQQYGGFGQQYGSGMGLGQGLEGIDLNNIPNVSTGGKGFQQQPQYNYQPAPVMRPYVDQVSTGGKGFQPRQTPSQSVAYAPMNIPGMSFAQPRYFYPNISQQMLGLGGMGGLGATMPMYQRPGISGSGITYPALQPPAPPPPPPPTSTGGKGFQPSPVMPNTPINPNLRPVMPNNPSLAPVSPRNPFEPTVQPIRYEDRELPRADQRIPQLEDSIYRDMPLFVPGYSNEPLVQPQASPYIANKPYVANEYDRPEFSMPSDFDRETGMRKGPDIGSPMYSGDLTSVPEEPVYTEPALDETLVSPPTSTTSIDRFEEPMYDTQDRDRGFMNID